MSGGLVAMNYWIDKAEKEKYWIEYAKKVLADPKATYSECKTAEIGVTSYSPDLAAKLSAKKGKPKSYI